MKTCCDCKHNLKNECFHPRKRGGLYSVCKECQKARWRAASAKSRELRERGERWEPERKSFVPPTDFLPMGSVSERIPLVYAIGVEARAA